eukprot:Awhi_evm1s4909
MAHSLFHLSESRSVKQLQVLKSSFCGPRRSSYKTRLCVRHYEERLDELNKKSKCSLYQRIQLDDMACINLTKKGMFKMKWYLNKMATSNRLQFKLVE